MSNLPPWWRRAGGIIAVVLLFVPGAQSLALVYLAVYLVALVLTRGSQPNSASWGEAIGGPVEKFMVGCFPYSLMIVVGLILMIAMLIFDR
jgi:hypothetical protein